MKKPLVIYDGSCGLCTGCLKWLYRLDWLKHFEALPYQSPEVFRLFPKLKVEDCEQAVQLAFPEGRILSGADAMRDIFRRMPLTFLLGILMHLPPVIWAARKLYPIIARNRYRLGGHCAVKR